MPRRANRRPVWTSDAPHAPLKMPGRRPARPADDRPRRPQPAGVRSGLVRMDYIWACLNEASLIFRKLSMRQQISESHQNCRQRTLAVQCASEMAAAFESCLMVVSGAPTYGLYNIHMGYCSARVNHKEANGLDDGKMLPNRTKAIRNPESG